MPTFLVQTLEGSMQPLNRTSLERLRSSVRGNVITSEDGGYDEARKLWNGTIDRSPAIIVRCVDNFDVITCINFARTHSVLVSVRGGGHGVAGNALNDGGLVIDLSGMRAVRVNASEGTALVQGGATIGDVDRETLPLGLAVPLGTVSETGVAGLSLHGGLGWLMRRHGPSADNIVSAEVVTADGDLVHASRDEHSDLLWAIRGGGGNFGVITSLEFKAYPVGPQVWTVFSGYPLTAAKEALVSFRDIMANAPNELMAIAMLWSVPRMPFIEWLHGKDALVVGAVYSGPMDKGEEVTNQLLRIPNPLFSQNWPIGFRAIQKSLDPEYPNGRRYYWKSAFVKELDDHLIDLMISRIQERPSPFSAINVWSLGGQFGATGQESSFGNRDAKFFIGVEANWEGPDNDGANIDWARRTHSSIVERTDAGVYLNFPGNFEEGEKMIRRAFGSAYSRLREVKSKYDPDDLFRTDFAIGALRSKSLGIGSTNLR